MERRDDENAPAPQERNHRADASLHLPAEMSSFIGRREVLHEAKQLLSSARLVTLTGVGGVGKTRLLMKLARELASTGTYRDGVVVVRLADLKRNDERLEATIADQLGILDNSRTPGLARLLEYLRQRQMLLCLDNCEHLVSADDSEFSPLPRLLRTLLRLAPKLQVMATSRDQLGIEGEHLLRVPPLHVPDVTDDMAVDGEKHEALQLLIDRARAIGVEIGADDYAMATRLCHRLDGLPLAIELAAVQLDAMTLAEMVEHKDLPQLLIDGPGELRHHRTLHATIAWSHKLLREPEQRMWSICSVCEGGFDREAAAALCRGRGIDEADVMALLARLVHKSLLVAEPIRGRTRYRMLETIRSFGRDQLTAQEAAELADDHAAYFEALAERAAREWFGADEIAWMHRIHAESLNLSAAQEHLLANPETALRGLVLEINASRTRARFFAGKLNESRRMLRRGLQAHPEEPTLPQVAALSLAAWVALCQGDQERAEPILQRAEAAARQLGCLDTFGPILYARGTRVWLAEPDITAARESLALLQKAAEAFLADGDRGSWWMARLFYVMSAAFLDERDVAIAESLSLLAEAEDADAQWCISWALWSCALVEHRFGDLHKAARLAQEALRMQHETGDRWGWVWSVWLIALIAALLGEHERAGQLLGGVAANQRLTEVSVLGLLPWLRVQNEAETTARLRLGEDSWLIQLEIGRSLTPGEVYALASTPFPDAPTSQAPTSHVIPGGLSAREYEIAGLIAAAKTNREIADELQVSTRTVETHVFNVSRKLGVEGGRVGIAMWFARMQAS